MKHTPKHIVRKVERMNALMEQLISLNMELEEWLEKNGIEDGFDFAYDNRDDRGYAILWPDQFIEKIDEAIN